MVDLREQGFGFMKWIAAAFLIIITMSACSHHSKHERQQRDQNSAAFKAGEAAHEIANHVAGAAAAAGRKLEDSARKAQEGWKAKDQKDRGNSPASQ